MKEKKKHIKERMKWDNCRKKERKIKEGKKNKGRTGRKEGEKFKEMRKAGKKETQEEEGTKQLLM